MVIYADTSFLFSLYGNDIHTANALQWIEHNKSPISVTDLNDFELGNALRFAEFRKAIKPNHAERFFAQYLSDQAKGRVIHPPCLLGQVVTEARRLSATHTLTGGHRGFDILHVASAIQLGATEFLTFDANQKKLAQAEGMTVPI